MVDNMASVEVSVTDVEAFEQGLSQAFVLGLMQGTLMRDDVGDSYPSPCDDCDCGLAEDVETTVVRAPAEVEFNEVVREYLERYDLVDEDDIVSKVEVCPRELVAHVRE